MLQVAIGFDPRQPVAFQVAAHSILARASRPVAIVPLRLDALPIRRRGLTEFTYSRFLTPWLGRFEGFSVFLDSDTLCRGDIWDILPREFNHPVWAVPHVGERQFERPAVMVFDNDKCRGLTPEFVEDPGNGLFDFAWAPTVGSLGKEWNHLVGYDPPNPLAKVVHFTMGIPVWPQTRGCEFSVEWHEEARRSMSTVSFEALMGPSVHVSHLAKLVPSD